MIADDRSKEFRMDATAPNTAPDITDLVEADSLVEEVSIDGMCGVY